MDLSLQVAALLDRERVQAASALALSSKVDRLSSQVGELSSTVARLSADNAHLASEVQGLKRELSAERITNIELSRAAAPDGHWIWETTAPTGAAGDRGGRWVWSLEKYASVPLLARHSGRPASLLSLPSELLRMIIKHARRTERNNLCSVSMRLLENTSSILSRMRLTCDFGRSLGFLCRRFEDREHKSARITPLLLPDEIHLKGRAPTDLDAQLTQRLGSTSHAVIDIPHLSLVISSVTQLAAWSPVLSRLNPSRFTLLTGTTRPSRSHAPTIDSLSAHTVAFFTAAWDRLEEMTSRGPGSVLLLPGDEGSELAIGECLRRGKPERRMEALVVSASRDVGLEKRQDLMLKEGEVRGFLEPKMGVGPGGTDWRFCVSL